MASPIVLGVAVLVIFFAVRYLNSSDVPKIKNLPEIPGVPLFGNLLQLGTDHALVAQKWAKQYGPVFQTRLGNKVSTLESVAHGYEYAKTWNSVLCLPTHLIPSSTCGSQISQH
jgi:phenylacetate 2-hydroxylase